MIGISLVFEEEHWPQHHSRRRLRGVLRSCKADGTLRVRGSVCWHTQVPRVSWWCSAHIDEASERDNKIYVIAARPSVGIKSRRCEIRGRDNK
jgi:hypothetical protein